MAKTEQNNVFFNKKRN